MKRHKFRNGSFRVLVVILFLFCSCQTDGGGNGSDCQLCQRIRSFSTILSSVSEKYWPGFEDTHYRSPLVYFTDSASFLCFSDSSLGIGSVKRMITCDDGKSIYQLLRLDEIPFHMENKIGLSDSLSPYFLNPVMFCSSPEKTLSMISDIHSTEEWVQLIMHEYFHSFQFRHQETIEYLSDTQISHDSLTHIYQKVEWYRASVDLENELLLRAISTNDQDSIKYFIRIFNEKRNIRVDRYKIEYGLDVSSVEKFWEQIEGTARYVEYYTGYVYEQMNENTITMECDSLFRGFEFFKKKNFDKRPWFVEKTKIMSAYFYVTGFNICRLLDKLNVKYKEQLFDNTKTFISDKI